VLATAVRTSRWASSAVAKRSLGVVGQEMKAIEDTSDYEFRRGLGIEMLDAYKKIHFGTSPVQHGVVTTYMAVA
jgi:hypothetical protein